MRQIRNLHIRRQEILSLPPEKALNAILEHPQCDALVHAFPEEDFYFLIHDIGVGDSLELLSMASDSQWEYILDVETWERDRMNLPFVTKWLGLLLEANPKRFISYVLKEKAELIEFYLFKNIQVVIREHDQDPSELGENFFTYDDVFYVRFTDPPFPDHQPDMEESVHAFLSEFLNRLAVYDHFTYQQVMLEFSAVIPAESEEEAYRLRNVRLAEKGFMPFDEAISIYQPLRPEDFKTSRLIKRLLSVPDRDWPVPVPLYPAKMLKEDNMFTRALEATDMTAVLEQLQTEFAGLCNQIISADQKIIREREALRHIITKACGYVSIGLEYLSGGGGKSPSRAAALIQKFPLSHIFRLGYGFALDLKWKAEKWQQKSWFNAQGLPLTFWGEQWLGVLGGLLVKKPLFYDNYKTGVLYREFSTLDDIRHTKKILNEIIAFDHLLSLTGISFQPLSEGFLTYKRLILTFWARHCLGLEPELLPIEPEAFAGFFNGLWDSREKPRHISLSVKASFLTWLSEQAGLDTDETTQRVGQTLESLFCEIESEYGEVSPKDLDPRYIHLFLVFHEIAV
ncbi:MAG: hypothetical protein B6245_19800 [Desulfobacteraceae bacterium 4572_88]|nr:MAG: hypothetical protein B6245_19800 [Desulfobacteraceae bacterium 4572_88]RLC03442.1 MAG: hypothetical protein DRI57_29125 [Deltaproteobacteria bacterium]